MLGPAGTTGTGAGGCGAPGSESAEALAVSMSAAHTSTSTVAIFFIVPLCRPEFPARKPEEFMPCRGHFGRSRPIPKQDLRVLNRNGQAGGHPVDELAGAEAHRIVGREPRLLLGGRRRLERRL